MPLQQTSGNVTQDAYGGGAASVPVYVENVFSTYLYTGTGSTQSITNNIALSTNGGMVWIKDRTNAYNNNLFDTTQGATKLAHSNTTDATVTDANSLTAFNTTGFTLGSGNTSGSQVNTSNDNFVSWSFRKQPKFFDIVTYTGNDTGQNISHNLGSVPGFIIIKSTSAAGAWYAYHSSLGNTKFLVLNSTSAAGTSTAVWNSTSPTSTQFTVGGPSVSTNLNGVTYVAYLFAHNAGGFGLTGTDNVISCGSFTASAGTGTVTLGYEPQWVLLKRTDSTQAWYLVDTMRGQPVTTASGQYLSPNSSAAEYTGGFIYPTATGFQLDPNAFGSGNNGTYIYIAIRRGPMAVPTTGTSVFTPALRTGTNGNVTTTTAGFPVDLFFTLGKNGSSNYPQSFDDRLRGTTTLYAYSTQTETTSGGTDFLNFATESGVNLTYNVADLNNSPGSYTDNYFVRAPSFFDVVCYTGNGTTQNINHNLNAVPELMIVKMRYGSGAGYWFCYSATLGNQYRLQLSTTDASAGPNAATWNSTTPTSTQFSVGAYAGTNNSGDNFVNYLFATCAGVSKVGSYTGNGTGQSIACGFGSSGARFILIKRTDSTGNWYYFNSADGLTSSSSPYIVVNTQVAYTTGNNGVYASSGGFTFGSTASTTTNINSASYIFLAIA